MAEGTNTLQTLRQDICKELQMPFFKKYGGAQTLDSGSTTSAPKDANLTQDNDYWNDSYFYHVDNQESRQIKDFVNSSNICQLEYALTSASSGDSYEIHSIWNAYDIHAAINRAIDQASKAFPATLVDETLVLEEDQLAYTISSLSSKPWRVFEIQVERSSNVLRGTATSGSATDLTDTALIGQLADVDTNWKISIYAGTGSGQIRSVSVANNTTGAVTPDSNWTTNPSNDSKYALWNPVEQIYDWMKVDNVNFDAKEYPDTVYFLTRIPALYGMRIRIKYLYIPTSLSAEADTTTVPAEYIIAKAVSILHGQMVGDTRYNRELHYGEHVRYGELADDLLKRYRIDTPDFTRWQDSENYYIDTDNPLGWGGGYS